MPHIPQGTTDTVALELFDPALDAALRPSPDYDVSRWLYVPNTYSEYRYILGTRGQKPLICVGINPSTAAPDALDPTLQSAQRIALNNGYDSFLMFNVYAQRATRPDDMERVCNSALHEENRKAFRYLLSLSETPAIWAAWGNIIEKRDYLMDCMRDFAADGQAALDLLEHSRVHLIITDVMMPRLDGYGLIRELRESGDTTPVLMVTVKDSFDDMRTGKTQYVSVVSRITSSKPTAL